MLRLSKLSPVQARSAPFPTPYITLGAHVTSWSELLLEAVAKVALGDADFRRALSIGSAPAGASSSTHRVERLELVISFDRSPDHSAVCAPEALLALDGIVFALSGFHL